jgi:hypothetical protein
MIGASSPLCIYLQDHHAGSVSAREMLARAMSGPKPDQEFFLRLDRDIEEDQAVLEKLINRLGAEESLPKKVGAWVAEKVARLKLGASDNPLSHLEFLEALTLGVQGKRCLWKALDSLPDGHPARQGLDLANLITRAEDQLARIEPLRLESFAKVAAGREG